jgi:hypothetical protein
MTSTTTTTTTKPTTIEYQDFLFSIVPGIQLGDPSTIKVTKINATSMEITSPQKDSDPPNTVHVKLAMERDVPEPNPKYTLVYMATNRGESGDAIVLYLSVHTARSEAEFYKLKLFSQQNNYMPFVVTTAQGVGSTEHGYYPNVPIQYSEMPDLDLFEEGEDDWDHEGYSWTCILNDSTFDCIDTLIVTDPSVGLLAHN